MGRNRKKKGKGKWSMTSPRDFGEKVRGEVFRVWENRVGRFKVFDLSTGELLGTDSKDSNDFIRWHGAKESLAQGDLNRMRVLLESERRGSPSQSALVKVKAPAMSTADRIEFEKAQVQHLLATPLDQIDWSKPTAIVTYGDGLWELRRGAVGIAIKHAIKARIPGLVDAPWRETFLLTVPRVPWDLFAAIVAFFREVNSRHHAEALVQVFWDPTTQRHMAYAPPQDVSGGKVEHTGNFDPDGKLYHMMDIHSHHTMDAYFSATDNGDEERFPGRCFGVIGKIEGLIPKHKWRARTFEAFIDLTIGDLIAVPTEETYSVKFSVASIMEQNEGGALVKILTDPFKGVEVPEAWYKALITERKATVVTGYRGWQGGASEAPHGLPFGHGRIPPSIHSQPGDTTGGGTEQKDLLAVEGLGLVDRRTFTMREGKLYKLVNGVEMEWHYSGPPA